MIEIDSDKNWVVTLKIDGNSEIFYATNKNEKHSWPPEELIVSGIHKDEALALLKLKGPLATLLPNELYSATMERNLN